MTPWCSTALMHWLDACARRLGELDRSLPPEAASRAALRLWCSSEPAQVFRRMHPVAAAEAWHAETVAG